MFTPGSLLTVLSIIFFFQCKVTRSNASSMGYATYQPRSTETCGDPSFSDIYIEGFSPSLKAHVFHRRFAFVHADTVGGGDWQVQGEVFRAWKSPQEGTVPMYRGFNPTTTDYIFLISPDNNLPVAAGFEVGTEIVAYVYPTQICGSIPLYVVFHDVMGDHWYTTIASERDDLVENGWLDSGIAAYVLPL